MDGPKKGIRSLCAIPYNVGSYTRRHSLHSVFLFDRMSSPKPTAEFSLDKISSDSWRPHPPTSISLLAGPNLTCSRSSRYRSCNKLQIYTRSDITRAGRQGGRGGWASAPTPLGAPTPDQTTAWGRVAPLTKPVAALPRTPTRIFLGKKRCFRKLFFGVQKYVYPHQTPKKFSTFPLTPENFPRKENFNCRCLPRLLPERGPNPMRT